MHTILKAILSVLLLIILPNKGFTQLVINEATNRNGNLIVDEDADYESWIEIYNGNPLTVNLNNYGLSDDSLNLFKWLLPNMDLGAGQFLFVFASGKDRKPETEIDHWEQPVNDATVWSYIVPDALIPASWTSAAYDIDAWATGLSSVGYGDGDDNSVIPAGSISVYLRNTFTVDDTSLIDNAIFSLDYDDGFVAYLNGNVIALNGFITGSPAYNELSNIDHEASMYGGGNPENFLIDESILKTYLIEGENILSIEVHNVTPGSSDITAIPFFAFGIKTPAIIWDAALPGWFPLTAVSENLHTNFKISNEGETVYFTNAAGVIEDELLVNVEAADHSIGCVTDGAVETGIFIVPTPGYTNSGTTYTGYTEGIAAILLDAGFYTGDQIIEISVPVGTTVHYTLNGAVPTVLDPIYTTPIVIDTTTVIRARVFSTADILLPGKTATNTFFINETISVPVFSISTNSDNLYGGNGIFDNWWTDWKKLAYIEYFDTTLVNAFEQNVGIKVDGGAGGSRSLEQKSMRIEPDNAAYGDGTLEFPVLSRRDYVNEYETFYLRNGSNMSNIMPYKDAFMVRTTEGTYNEHMAYEPVVVFINGEYWGLYELRNKIDEGYLDRAKGIEKDSLDLLTLSYWYGLVLRTLSGSDADFIAMRNYLGYYPTPEDPEFYAIADSILDLKNFTDYVLGQSFFANYDWPYNNIKAWRDRGGDNKWKYAIIDVELGLFGGWSDVNANLLPGYFYTQSYIEPLAALLQNPIYHDYFVNRYADLLNSTFLPERTLAMEDSIYQQVIPELPRQLVRWGYGTLPEQISTFNTYRVGLRNDFENRSDKVRTHIKNAFDLDGKVEITLECSPAGAGRIKISTLTIFDMPWSGIYFDGVPVQITAEPNTGYTFSNWGDSPFITDELLNSFLSNIDEDVTFTAYFEGAAAPSLITINEINYNPEPTVNAGNWLELYNYGDADVNISGWILTDANPIHNFVIPESTWINTGERLVFATDMSLFIAQHPDVLNVIGPIGFGLNNAAETIQLFDLQLNIMAEINYTDDTPWPGGADGQGRTMELNNPLLGINNPDNWFDGCIGGSPGLPYSPCADPVIFSEVNYNSGADFNSADWVELRNISNTEVDISGWKFMDDSIGLLHEYLIADGTILESASNHVLVQHSSMFNTVYPDVANYQGPFNFNLSEGGEWIRMYDAAGILVLSVNYKDTYPWPLAADGGSYTLELVDSLGLMNSGFNWEYICPGGSPGEYATSCADTTVAINDYALQDFSLSPNPASNLVNISFTIPYAEFVTITIVAIDGSESKTLFSGWIAEGKFSRYFSIENNSAGIYLINITSKQGAVVRKLVKQ